MSFHTKHFRAQFNYHPEHTRPGGTGQTRLTDPKRPQETGHRPGEPRSGRSERRPRRT
jgi:hypothetical protein